MTTTTATATTCQTLLGFQIDMMISDGWLPANIGVELGSDAIRKHYQTVRNRGYHHVDNWLLAIIAEATRIESQPKKTEAVYSLDRVIALTESTSTAPLN